MSTQTATPPTATAAPEIVEQPRQLFRWSLERYHQAIESGLLNANDRVELIEGQIIDKMSIGKRHRDSVDLLTAYLVPKYIKDYVCAAQNPITLPDHSEPEPDFAIIRRETYAKRTGQPLPEDVALVIEVSDSTLYFDRTTKARLYATANIPEYWIIDLKNDRVEVHTRPDAEAGVYLDISRRGRGETFASPFNGETTVEELIPPAV